MQNRNVFAALVGAAVLALSTALPAAALAASDFGPIVTFAEDGDLPAISGGPADGSALVVYRGYDAVNDTDEIYGQLVTNELGMLGSPFLVSNTTDGDSTNAPTAEWNPEREEWLVVWEEYNDALDSEVIAARIVEPGVGAVGGQFIVSDNHGADSFSDIELAYSAYATDQDVYLVVFKALVQVIGNPSCQAAFGAFVNADATVPTLEATLLSTTDVISCPEEIDNGTNVDYSVASSRWLVGFGYQNGDTGASLVENVFGLPTVTSTVLVGGNNNVVHPSVDHDSTRDRFLLGWHYNDVSTDQIFGALVDGTGTQVGSDFAVTPEDARGDQRAPRMVFDAAADVFRMVNHNTGTDEPFIGYWELDGATGASTAAPEVLSDLTVTSERPDVTLAGDCVLVVWQSERYDAVLDATIDALQGRSSCFTPQLAATGSSDAATAVGIGAAVALMLGSALLITRRRQTAA